MLSIAHALGLAEREILTKFRDAGEKEFYRAVGVIGVDYIR